MSLYNFQFSFNSPVKIFNVQLFLLAIPFLSAH